MEELIQQITERTGISEEQAMKAVETMKEFISSKVPPMFSGFVDNFFTSGGSNPADELSKFL